MAERLAMAGPAAVVAATAVTTLAAALAVAAGVDLRIAADQEPIPLSGIAFVTAICTLAGVALAAALRRWSARPAARFTGTALLLTAASLVPPVLSDAEPATATTLVALHLVAAAVAIPALARSLRA
jgi:hypothetical protein